MFKGKRAVFPAGEQRKFLDGICQKETLARIALICKCSERTVRDWRREKFSMPLGATHALSTHFNVPISEKMCIRDAYAHIPRASRMGAAATIKKYGSIPRNEEHRKKQWRLWWESTGKLAKNPILESKIVYRPKHGAKLAEFIGIMMGDGGLTMYQAIVTLHHVDDLEYASFVKGLIKRLFKIEPKMYHSPKNSVNDIVVSRKKLVIYLHELGLPIGNKIDQRLDIPLWIRCNRTFAIACLRGLVDTDGCVFTHRYRVKGTWYAYKKLSFTSASKPLLESVHDLLQELGFHPRTTAKDVRLDRTEDIRRYFKIIGSHNPKHLRRYENTLG